MADSPFREVCNMETPLATVEDLLHAISYIAETISDDDQGSAIQRLAWLAGEQCKAAEAGRGTLFRLTHPNRERFEREGWPAVE